MSWDMTSSIQPDSTQINADDLVGASMTITVSSVTQGTREQPVNIHTVEYPDRAYRPSKTMRKLIVAGWGRNPSDYAGRRITLYRNPDITFGREKVGGIEISHMSHIEKTMVETLRVARGKVRRFTVEVLAEPVTEPWRAQWQAISNALTEAGYTGDSLAMLATAGTVIGQQWDHPNKISAEDAQKILAAVRENENEEGK